MIAFDTVPDADQRRNLHFEAQRQRALADDLDRIADGGFPNQTTLAAAPLLDDFSLTPIMMPVLAGAVTGHPRLPGNQRRIATSIVEVLSPSLGWARTQSRFFRLGHPSDADFGALKMGGLVS